MLVGQSGMGKSTIINALIPGTDAVTAEISTAMDSGRHTTTHARLYHLAPESSLIDSPGMQEFGLHHLTEQDIAAALPEFRPLLRDLQVPQLPASGGTRLRHHPGRGSGKNRRAGGSRPTANSSGKSTQARSSSRRAGVEKIGEPEKQKRERKSRLKL